VGRRLGLGVAGRYPVAGRDRIQPGRLHGRRNRDSYSVGVGVQQRVDNKRFDRW
jgi:hypothetical protein